MTTRKISFKEQHTLDKREQESERIKRKYPDRVPVIVEKIWKSHIGDIDKHKYLVPADLTVGQFVYIIRRRLKLEPEKAIFIFVNNSIPATGTLMSLLYKENKDKDGFLYVSYSGESTFGSTFSEPSAKHGIFTLQFPPNEDAKTDQKLKAAMEKMKSLQAKHGVVHPEVAQAMKMVAFSFWLKGDYTNALHYYEEVLTIAKQVYEPGNPELVRSFKNVAAMLSTLNRSEEADHYLDLVTHG